MKKWVTLAVASLVVVGSGCAALGAAQSAACCVRRTPHATRFAQLQADFSRLPGGERRKIYRIGDQITQQQVRLMERYAQCGMLSEEEADILTEQLEEANDWRKEEGLIPATLYPIGR